MSNVVKPIAVKISGDSEVQWKSVKVLSAAADNEDDSALAKFIGDLNIDANLQIVEQIVRAVELGAETTVGIQRPERRNSTRLASFEWLTNVAVAFFDDLAAYPESRRRSLLETIIGETELLNLLSLLAEGNDLKGNYTAAVKIITPLGDNVLDAFWTNRSKHKIGLPKVDGKAADSRALLKNLRQRLWVLLNYVHLSQARCGQLQAAKRNLQLCAEICEQAVAENIDFYLYGTRSRCAYYLALVLFEAGELEKSRLETRRALSFAFERVETKTECLNAAGDGRQKEEKVEWEQIYARHCHGKVEGFCHSQQSRLRGHTDVALTHLRTAEVCLADTTGSYFRGLILIEKGNVLTMLAGFDTAALKRAADVMREGLEALKTHPFHYLRAKIEFASHHLRVAEIEREQHPADYGESAEYQTALQEAVELSADVKNDCGYLYEGIHWRVHLLAGRVATEKLDLDEALTQIRQAAVYVKQEGNHYGQLIVSIAEGEAHLRGATAGGSEDSQTKMGDLTEADRRFRQVRDKANGIDLIEAYCTVRLAQTLFAQDSNARAFEELKKWETDFEKKTDYEYLRCLVAELKKKLNQNGEPFIIYPKDDLNFKNQTVKLKDWLVQQAKIKLSHDNEPVTEKKIAEELGYKSHNSVPKTEKSRLKIE